MLSLKSTASATVVGLALDAKKGTKVTAKLIRSGKVRKKSTLKAAADHSFKWKIGKLTAGTYTARFSIAGKVIKTTTIKVKAVKKHQS